MLAGEKKALSGSNNYEVLEIICCHYFLIEKRCGTIFFFSKKGFSEEKVSLNIFN